MSTTALRTVRVIAPFAPVSLMMAMVAAGEVAKEMAPMVRPTGMTAALTSPMPGRAMAGMAPLTSQKKAVVRARTVMSWTTRTPSW